MCRLYFPRVVVTKSYDPRILLKPFSTSPLKGGIYVSSLWSWVDLCECLNQQSGRRDAVWLLRLDYKGSSHFCLALVEPNHYAMKKQLRLPAERSTWKGTASLVCQPSWRRTLWPQQRRSIRHCVDQRRTAQPSRARTAGLWANKWLLFQATKCWDSLLNSSGNWRIQLVPHVIHHISPTACELICMYSVRHIHWACTWSNGVKMP